MNTASSRVLAAMAVALLLSLAGAAEASDGPVPLTALAAAAPSAPQHDWTRAGQPAFGSYALAPSPAQRVTASRSRAARTTGAREALAWIVQAVTKHDDRECYTKRGFPVAFSAPY